MEQNRTIFVKTLFVFILLFCTSFKVQQYEARIILENTGNETVYVAYGYHDWKGYLVTPTGWKSTYCGWVKIEPGEREPILSIGDYDEATFAFSKRNGYVVYKIKNNTGIDIGVDEIYVDPINEFKYIDEAPASFVPIKRSFALKFKSNDVRDPLYQTIEIPSYTTDKVIPIKANSTETILDEKEKPVKTNSGSKHFKIYSDTIHNTLTVSKGDTIKITASGTIDLGLLIGSCGPKGINSFNSLNRIKGFRHGALLVRVGDKGIWESVELSKKIIANSSGFLQFIVNDDTPSSNTGAFNVNIVIKKR